MKTLQHNLFRTFLALGLCAATTAFPACNSGDDEVDPCGEFECLNGGEKITGVDQCECDCPPGYSGANCETKDATCPPSAECPIGQSPNPANDCQCE